MSKGNENDWQEGIDLKNLSTFRIGGRCRYYIAVHSNAALCSVLRRCKKEMRPFFILGKGSNSLFDDRGFDGVVIHNKIDHANWLSNHQIEVGAGYSFSLLGTRTARKGWSGLEFAAGIPGSVGGAVFMNAGANGSECCDVLSRVKTVTKDGIERVYDRNQLIFGYRCSPFQKNQEVIVEATFQLVEKSGARERQQKILEYRLATQPYDMPSVGCIFRNPDGVACASGALIEAAGCKGERYGDAMVSEKHANFIVNHGNASADEVEKLIKRVQKKVYDASGILLEPEVQRIQFGDSNG